MPIPYHSGKTSLERLSDMKSYAFSEMKFGTDENSCLFQQEISNFKFDYLWHPMKDSKRLFVLFSGDAMRKRNNPPVFQRWSWASYFPGNCLYVSDPTLHLDDNIGLAWYAGTEDFDPLPAIADVVREICLQLEINAGQVFTYGSSGGGFAALRMGEFLPHSGAVAVNPQIIVTDYQTKRPERYLNLCFSGRSRATAIREFEDRLSILSHTDRLRSQRCIYIQNTLDAHHYEHHFVPFCAKMGEEPAANTTDGTFRRLLFAHPDGHRKAETQDMFDAAMNIVENW